MRRRLIKTNVPGLRKDSATGAVLNTDGTALAEHLRRRGEERRAREVDDRIAALERRLEDLEGRKR